MGVSVPQYHEKNQSMLLELEELLMLALSAFLVLEKHSHNRLPSLLLLPNLSGRCSVDFPHQGWKVPPPPFCPSFHALVFLKGLFLPHTTTCQL